MKMFTGIRLGWIEKSTEFSLNDLSILNWCTKVGGQSEINYELLKRVDIILLQRECENESSHMGSSVIINSNNNLNSELINEPQIIESIVIGRQISLSETNLIQQETTLVRNNRASEAIIGLERLRESMERQRIQFSSILEVIVPPDNQNQEEVYCIQRRNRTQEIERAANSNL
jgi:hypothetical protein